MAYTALQTRVEVETSPFRFSPEAQWWKDERLTLPIEDVTWEASTSLGTYLGIERTWLREAGLSLTYEFERELEGLDDIYLFRERTNVLKFLRENAFLVELLLEAYIQIQACFGPNSDIFLELHRDPEENFEELFIVIKSPYTAEEVRELMDKLGEVWFLDVMDKTQGKLCLTEEPL